MYLLPILIGSLVTCICFEFRLVDCVLSESVVIDQKGVLFILFQSPTDNFFSSDPFKPSGGSSDPKKTTDSNKDSSTSVKDPFSNPFGSDPFGELVVPMFSLFEISAFSLPFSSSLLWARRARDS